MVACPTDGSFYHSYGLSIYCHDGSFINLHTKLTIQVFIYLIYVAGHNKIQIWKIQTKNIDTSLLFKIWGKLYKKRI